MNTTSRTFQVCSQVNPVSNGFKWVNVLSTQIRMPGFIFVLFLVLISLKDIVTENSVGGHIVLLFLMLL